MFTPIKLTDSAALGISSSSIQYSTVRPESCDDHYALINEISSMSLYDLLLKKRIEKLDWLGDSDPNVPNGAMWSRIEGASFYYTQGNSLFNYNIDTKERNLHRQFTEYSLISSKGEADLGADNDSVILCGDDKEVFIYHLRSNIKSTPVIPGFTIDGITITPDGNILISGSEGIWLYRYGFTFVSIWPRDTHKTVTRDIDGSECVILYDDGPNDIVKVNLKDCFKTILITFGWNPNTNKIKGDELAFHITATLFGKVLFETYRPKWNGTDSQLKYQGQLVQLPLDGSEPIIICEHGSSGKTYESQPRASISQDGTVLLFNSDKNGSTDVYMINLNPSLTPQPVIPEPLSIGIDSSMVYQDARGGNNLSLAIFKNGILIANINL